ncbi:MAG TPA: cytochrome P450 [Candidatus Dormibacteraeota bacterium]|nr:cytochrome P450 [Candidatus Dormibacteraeota bacterium]
MATERTSQPADSERGAPQRGKVPPGPVSTGRRKFSGQLGPVRRDPLGFFTHCAKTYGDITGMRYFNFRVFFINHPDYIEDVLVNNARKFHKGRVLQANKGVFGEGLLTSEGSFWLRQRRLAQPAFHRARIATYAETMVQYTQRMLESWRDGEECDIHEEMMRVTLQIVGKTLFDADVTKDAREVGQSLELLMELSADFGKTIMIPEWVPTVHNLRKARAIRKLDKIIYRIIEERRKSERDTGDLLSMLLAARDDDGSRMTDKQLRDESITLFLAGHETTANALSWTWWLLAQNPEAENKLHAELDGLLAGRAPTLDDVPKLKYTEQVLTESMRLYPPAWGTARVAMEDHEIGGYHVPKGTGVSLTQWTMHRDPRWFTDPEVFRPERWEDGLAKRLPRFAYFPFGGGPRQCIGNTFALMEATLVLATIAQKFRFRLVAGHPVVPLPSITLRPRHGIRAFLEAR